MSRYFVKYFIITLSLIQLSLPSQVLGANSDFSALDENSKIRLISTYHKDENQQQKLLLGVHFKLKENWKIYGQSDSSFTQPPTFDFSNSQNINKDNFNILWPEPKIIEEDILGEIISYPVYENEVVIPIEINVQDLDQTTYIDVKINYGLCNEICIPVQQSLKLEIASGDVDQDSLNLIKNTNNSTNSAQMTLISAIIISFIGGLILNIMPCVLPVLSIKLLSIIKHSKSSIKKIRIAFTSTTLGILFCFLLFATIISILKAAGNAIGWGVQFQNPYFLILLVLILTIFSANLMGLFEINIGSTLSNIINRKIKNSDKKDDLLHVFFTNFLSGILAVLLATPCSAPFLGTAISFAFSQNSIIIFTIFIFMALGLAFPYILLTIFPQSVKLLPKPGNWMNFIKQLMAIFLITTIAWLVTILSSNLGFLSASLIATLSAFILLCFKICANAKIPRNIEIVIISIIAIFMIIAPIQIAKYTQIQNQFKEGLWLKFNESQIDELVEQGNVVLIDITADWCITCKVNKALVLDSKEIVEKLQESNIIAMRGDLTKPNRQISQFMESHNRYAIPFNIVYGPNAKDGLLLSEFLSKKDLLETINKAK